MTCHSLYGIQYTPQEQEDTYGILKHSIQGKASIRLILGRVSSEKEKEQVSRERSK